MVICLLNIGLFIVLALFEEIVFRVIVYNYFLKIFNKNIISIILSSLVFGLFHFVNLRNSSIDECLIQVLYSTCTGCLFCFIYYFCDNFVLCVTSHFLYNLFNLLLFNKFYSGPFDNSFYLWSIIIGILCFVYCLILFIKNEKTLKINR